MDNLTPEEWALRVFNSDDLLFNPYVTGSEDNERFVNKLLQLNSIDGDNK